MSKGFYSKEEQDKFWKEFYASGKTLEVRCKNCKEQISEYDGVFECNNNECDLLKLGFVYQLTELSLAMTIKMIEKKYEERTHFVINGGKY